MYVILDLYIPRLVVMWGFVVDIVNIAASADNLPGTCRLNSMMLDRVL